MRCEYSNPQPQVLFLTPSAVTDSAQYLTCGFPNTHRADLMDPIPHQPLQKVPPLDIPSIIRGLILQRGEWNTSDIGASND